MKTILFFLFFISFPSFAGEWNLVDGSSTVVRGIVADQAFIDAHPAPANSSWIQSPDGVRVGDDWTYDSGTGIFSAPVSSGPRVDILGNPIP